MKNFILSLTVLLVQTLSAASQTTTYLQVSFIGDTSLVSEKEIASLEDTLIAAYNCQEDYDDTTNTYGRTIESALVSLDSIVIGDGDLTHFSWIMELQGEAPSCTDGGLFAPQTRTRRNLDKDIDDAQEDIVYDRPHQASTTTTHVQLLGGVEGSRKLSSQTTSCGCPSIEDVTSMYKQKLVDLNERRKLSETISFPGVSEITSMQLVDPIECGEEFEEFQSFARVEYRGTPNTTMTNTESLRLAEAIVHAFNNGAAEFCDHKFRSVASAEIVGEGDRRRRDLFERRSSLSSSLFALIGQCYRCTTDGGLFDQVSGRMLEEEWMMVAAAPSDHQRGRARNLNDAAGEGQCFCHQNAVADRGQSTIEFVSSLNDYIQANAEDFPSVEELLLVEEVTTGERY
jgi:hypothetical protein